MRRSVTTTSISCEATSESARAPSEAVVSWYPLPRIFWKSFSMFSLSSTTSTRAGSISAPPLRRPRQPQRETGPPALRGPDHDLPAVGPRDGLGHGQPEARAARLGREEGLEEPVADRGSDAGTAVAHRHLHLAAVLTHAHRDPAAAVGGLGAVLDEIEENLPQAVGVALGRAGPLDAHRDRVEEPGLLQPADHVLAQLAEVHRLGGQRVGTGQVEEALDDLPAAECLLLDDRQVLVEGAARLLPEEAGVAQDDPQGVVDLVGHAGGQASDAGELLALHQTLLMLLEGLGHGVELARQGAELVGGVDPDPGVEVAAGQALGALLQAGHRAGHRSPHVPAHRDGQHR